MSPAGDGHPRALAEYPGRLNELRGAVAAGDGTRIERAAHGLKGALAIFGASVALALAEELEAMGRAGRLDGAPDVLRRFEHAFERITTVFGDPGWMSGG